MPNPFKGPFAPRTGGPIPPKLDYREPSDVQSWGHVKPPPVAPGVSPSPTALSGATPFANTLQWLVRALGMTSNVVPQGVGQLPLDPVLDVVQRGWALASWRRVSWQFAPPAGPPETLQSVLLAPALDTQVVTAMTVWHEGDVPGVVTIHRQLVIADGDPQEGRMSIRAPVLYQGAYPAGGDMVLPGDSHAVLSWAALNGDAQGVWVVPPGQALWMEMTWPDAGDAGNIDVDMEVGTLPGMFQGR